MCLFSIIPSPRIAARQPLNGRLMPAFGAPSLSRTAGNAVRSALIYVPNGMTMRDWSPATAGSDYAMTSILKAFEPYRQDMLVLTGMMMLGKMDVKAETIGDSAGKVKHLSDF
jgi:hypothetical protein